MKRTFFILILISIWASAQAQIVDSRHEDNSHYGFVDANGQWVGPHDYDFTSWDINYFHGYIRNSRFQYGVVDKSGKIVIPMQYDNIFCRESCIITKKDDLYGAYNYNYKKILNEEYSSIETGKLYIRYKKGNKWGACDKQGNIVVPTEYDYLSGSSSDQLIIYIGKGWRGTGDNFANVKQYGLYYEGKLVVPCQYDSLVIAGEGLYSVRKNGKWGYCGEGMELISPQYDAVTVFTNGVARVRKDGELKLIKNPLRSGEDIKIASTGKTINNKKKSGPAISRYPAPDSDVDKNIPETKKQAGSTFAFIIANENYPDAPVPYSLNDGRMFREYCQKTLGLPEKNINLYEDATYGTIINAVEKMKKVADAFEGESNIIFYYAGHGFPDDKLQTAYLLPIDGSATDIANTGYSLGKLYKEIADLPVKSSVVLLDACFSGTKREDQMLSASRGVAIKVKQEATSGNMIVFSAAQGDETAHQLEEKHHGLFTYYLLKELQQTSGEVDLGTLTDYVTKQVKRQSVVINNKKQTPTVTASSTIQNTWKEMKLK